MAKAETPIVLVTQTRIQIAVPTEQPTEKAKAKPKPSPKKARLPVKVEPPKAPAKAKPSIQPAKMLKVTPKVKAEKPKASKTPTVKPNSETQPEVAAKNQEAVRTGKVPNRLDVEPGRYDMLLS